MAESFEFELQILAGNHSNERKGKIKRKKENVSRKERHSDK